ncbi:MAG: hypothetical protein WD603_02620 [Patescibacteria group bacterium]
MKERASERWPDEEPPKAETGPPRRARKSKPADRGTSRERADQETSDRPERSHDRNPDKEVPEDIETTEPDPQTVRRRLAAEAAFRKRVALAELEEKLGDEEAYEAVRDVLERSGGQWHLEQGRHLLHRLVSETAFEEAEPSAVRGVSIKLATRRESEPVAPRELVDRVKAACEEPVRTGETIERVAAAAEALPDEDDLSVTVRTTDHDEVRVEVGHEVVRAVTEREGEEVVLDERTRSHRPTTATESEPPDLPVAEDASDDAVEDGPPVPGRSSESAPEPVLVPDGGAVGEVSDDLGAVEDEPLPPEPRTPLGKAIERIETAWWETEVPPVAGGSPELDETTEAPDEREQPGQSEVARHPELSEEERRELNERLDRQRKEREAEETLPEGPPPPKPPPDRPKRRAHRRPVRVITYERGGEAPRWVPDREFRQKARKLIRRLAFRHGLKLSTEMETFLLQILLRPRLVNGRLVHGMTVNLDVLIRTIESLREHYPLYTRRRPA